MRFDEPGWLALLVLAPLLVVAYALARRRPGAPRGAGRHLTAGALLLTVVGLVLALAHPVLVVPPAVQESSATVVVALDVSNSMDDTDVAPNRIEAAAVSARDFVADLPQRFTVGLVLFGGTAETAVPPTTDHQAVLDRLSAISLSSLRSGTAIGDAVVESLAAVRTAPRAGEPAPARIVLLSDGASTQGRSLDEAATAATGAAVPVSTIAFGVSGAADEIDIPALERLAAQTGGQTYRAASGAELRAVYADVGSTITGTATESDLLVPVLLATLTAALLTAIGGLLARPQPGRRGPPAAQSGPSDGADSSAAPTVAIPAASGPGRAP
jgi:Ca-activated chloride channel family protein